MLDLHAHSYFSDGTSSPKDLAQLAKGRGLKTLALTDHDNVAGLLDFQKACAAYQIRPILGVEITIDASEGLFHLLGLGIDPANKRLQQALKEAIDLRTKRMKAMLQHVKDKYDLNVAFAFLPEVAYGRFHMAILLRDQHNIPLRVSFDEYLKEFKNEGHISAQDAINLVHEAGGKAVIAHPTTISKDKDTCVATIEACVAYGLDALEVYSGRHTEEEIAIFKGLVAKHNLLITAGSDFHGANKPDARLGFWKTGDPITSDLISSYWLKSS